VPEGGGASVVPLERRFLTRFGGWLVTRDRRTKLVIALSADVLLLLACATLAILLIAGHIHLRPSALPTLLLLPFVTVVSLYVSGTYRAVIRYVDADFVGRCLYGLLLALGPLMVWAYIDTSQIASLRVLCAFMLLALASLSGVRWMARHLLKPDLPRGNRPRVMIYGAGDAGAQLACMPRLASWTTAPL
jgi:FlaA1/EpsC-like NDP-sugar epimerase